MVELLLHGDVMLDQGLFEFIVRTDGQEVNVDVRLHRAGTGQFTHFAYALVQLAAADYQGIQAIGLLNHVEADVD